MFVISLRRVIGIRVVRFTISKERTFTLIKHARYIQYEMQIEFTLSRWMEIINWLTFFPQKSEPVAAEIKFEHNGQTWWPYRGIWADTRTVVTTLNDMCIKSLIIATLFGDKWFPISDKLEKQLSGRIPGLYHLLLTIWDRPLDLDGDNREKSEKIKKLEKILLKTVKDSASNIEDKETVDLSDKIRAYLPHIVSMDFEASLQRITGGESCLVIEMQMGGDAPSIALQGNQFTKFRTLVQKANGQLGKAKVRGISETFFIWLDLLYHLPAPPDAIRNTLRQLNSEDHCNIDYVYHVANSVTRIIP